MYKLYYLEHVPKYKDEVTEEVAQAIAEGIMECWASYTRRLGYQPDKIYIRTQDAEVVDLSELGLTVVSSEREVMKYHIGLGDVAVRRTPRILPCERKPKL